MALVTFLLSRSVRPATAVGDGLRASPGFAIGKGRCGRLKRLFVLQVVNGTGKQDVPDEKVAGFDFFRPLIVKRNGMPAGDFGRVALNNDRRRFVNPDSQQLREPFDDAFQIRQPVSLREMLIDGGAGQEPQAALVAGGHHVGVAQWIPPHHVLRLNRSAGRTSADDATTFEHIVDKRLGLCPFVSVHEPPLASAAKPQTARLRQRRQHFLALNLLAAPLGKNLDVPGTEPFEVAFEAFARSRRR